MTKNKKSPQSKKGVHTSIFGTYTDQDVAEAFGAEVIPSDKKKFATGAVRDIQEGKEDYIESVSWLALRRFALYMNDKASKYGIGNWIKGIPIESYESSLMRHLQKYFAEKYNGVDYEPDYDHLSAAMFNLQGIMHEQEKLKNGKK